MKHTLAVRRLDMLPVRTFGFFGEESAFVPQAVGRLAVWYSSDGEYMKNSEPWKRIHPAGPLDRCQRPHVHRNLAVDEKQCPPFRQPLGGVYPFLSSAH